MNRKFLAVAAAAFALGSASVSAATFTFGLLGTIESASTPCLHNPVCDITALPWNGTLTVETTSTVDGTYFEGSLPLVDFESNWYSFTRSGGYPNGAWDSAFVTLSGGRPVSIGVDSQTSAWEVLTINGMTASYGFYDAREGEAMAPFALGTATIAALPTVPEPASVGLLLAGLLVLGLRCCAASATPARLRGCPIA